jgi:hypothetical protein
MYYYYYIEIVGIYSLRELGAALCRGNASLGRYSLYALTPIRFPCVAAKRLVGNMTAH